MKRLRTTRPLSLWLVLLGGVVAGCGNDVIRGDFVSNQPPQTSVTSTPPVLGQTTFTVEFFWTGSDPDSEVRGFEWRISNNGIDGIVDPADTLSATLPWNFTTAPDSVFVVSAEIDSFQIDVNDPRQGADDYRFWQTHTFFIRAVDDAGMRDPTPAEVSFTATTLAPTIVIDVPTSPSVNSCVSAARVLTFGWTGEDPDNPTKEPAEVRFLLRRIGGAVDPCLTASEFRMTSPIRSDDADWSDWIAYDAADDSGKVVTLPKQQVGDAFLFAVQARDLAGAVTPTFVWGRNIRHVRIGIDKFPALTVTERFLGTETFVATNRIKAFDIVQGQELRFEWNADASPYAGIIDAFRYGWDIADPDDENDQGWAVAWGIGASWKRAQPRSFLQGSHNFVVQVRDNSGTITRVLYQLQVIQIAARVDQKSVLLVDDFREEGSVGEALGASWDRRWKEHLQGVVGFQDRDVIDAQSEGARLKFATLNEYKSVIWFTNSSTQSFFHNEFAPVSTTQPQFNWLEVYQAEVGNLLLVGPGAAYNSFERNPPNWLFPVVFNVPVLGELGFGEGTAIDGSKFNRGTTRYPYSAWCLETVDIVRPAFARVFSEPVGKPDRVLGCSAIYRARVDEEFFTSFPDAANVLTDLQPTDDRKNLTQVAAHKFPFEEFYNRNLTSRSLSLVLRDCQTTMYRAEARVDAQEPDPDPDLGITGVHIIPSLSVCAEKDGKRFNRATAQPGDFAAGVTTSPIGIVSSVYSASKQLPGSSDFLWGFNPMGFKDSQVKAAVQWIIRSGWDIQVE